MIPIEFEISASYRWCEAKPELPKGVLFTRICPAVPRAGEVVWLPVDEDLDCACACKVIDVGYWFEDDPPSIRVELERPQSIEEYSALAAFAAKRFTRASDAAPAP